MYCGCYTTCTYCDAGSKVFMLASTVSSKFIRAMAEAEGFQFVVSYALKLRI
jgi:hypothetical protein